MLIISHKGIWREMRFWSQCVVFCISFTFWSFSPCKFLSVWSRRNIYSDICFFWKVLRWESLQRKGTFKNVFHLFFFFFFFFSWGLNSLSRYFPWQVELTHRTLAVYPGYMYFLRIRRKIYREWFCFNLHKALGMLFWIASNPEHILYLMKIFWLYMTLPLVIMMWIESGTFSQKSHRILVYIIPREQNSWTFNFQRNDQVGE